MALSATVVKMLNDFADSQPALRISGLPLGQSNPKLGDALAAADLESKAYVAADAADWSNDAPATVKEALDRLAAALGPIA
jgi:hypothetical protein